MKTIGILAPSGACEKNKIERAAFNLEKLGYKVKLAKNICDKNRYLAGSDSSKIESIHEFYKDSEIDLILSARGGYGALRLINDIDYEIIKNNPKPICGYSDITALLLMIYKKTGQITFHGPMAIPDFGNENINIETYNSFLKSIECQNLEFKGNEIIKEGCASGILWGGNLSTVVSLCGLDFIPNEDFIFFAEDINEPVYKIDKMFRQLFNIESFKNNCKGIVLGDFLEVDNQIWLNELFEEFSVPTVAGFKITHAENKITLPIGKSTILDGLDLIIN